MMRRHAALLVFLLGAWSCSSEGGAPRKQTASERARSAMAASQAAATEAMAAAEDVPEPGAALKAANAAAVHERTTITVTNFTVSDNSVSGPDSAPVGAVQIHLTNRGAAVHELQFWLMPEQASIPEVMATLTQTGGLPRYLTLQGGAGPLLPGGSVDVIQPLGKGTYLVLCPLRDKDGKRWFTKGVTRLFRVYGEMPAILQPPLVEARSALLTSAGGWKFGATIWTGPGRSVPLEGRYRITYVLRGENTIMIDNYSSPAHEIVILRANEPAAMRQYVDWLEGRRPDPPQIVGGIPGLYALQSVGGLAPQRLHAYIRIRLEKGAYIMFCPRRRAGTSMFDFELGEFQQFVAK